MAGTKADQSDAEGVGRVVVGVLLTLALWLLIPPFLFVALLTFSPPFLLAIIVSLAATRMHWTRRTALASALIYGAASIVEGVVYLHDIGHLWAPAVVIVFVALSVTATWLAWAGGLIIATHRARATR
jgi:hypothetical protein